MRTFNLPLLTSLTAIGLISLSLVTSQTKSHQVDADTPASNAQIKALYSEKCSACHDLPDPEEKGYTKAQWQSTVNRMLTAHGASNSISDVQAAQIVDYLGLFAPKASNNPAANGIGVWQNDPVVSVAYPFTYAPNLSHFDVHGGAWRVVETPDITSGFLKENSAAGVKGMIIENRTNITGALDLQTQFHINQSSGNAAVGLIFAATDAKNYLEAEYLPGTNAVLFSKVTNGQAVQLQQAPVDSTLASSPDGWHSLRVKVTEGGAALEVMMDFQRLIQTSDPAWQGGEVGLITEGPTVVGFRQFTIDCYDSSVASPAGNILLH